MFKTLRIIYSLTVLLVTVFTSNAYAQEHIALSIGQGNIAGSGNAEQTVEFNAEYRFHEIYQGVRPTFGLRYDSESALYGFAGINYEIDLSDKWVISPSFMAGLYSQGASHDLGGALEFRSGIEVDYKMENEARVGLIFTHTSNAGIYDENPGMESLSIVYSHPISWIAR